MSYGHLPQKCYKSRNNYGFSLKKKQLDLEAIKLGSWKAELFASSQPYSLQASKPPSLYAISYELFCLTPNISYKVAIEF